MYNYDQATEIFTSIISSPEESKAALQDPSSVLIKHGLTVPDPEKTNSIFFEVAPQLKAHFIAAAAGQPHANALLGCSSPKCIACKAVLGAALAVALAGALAEGGAAAAAITDIAEYCGLSEQTVKAIITASGGSIGSCIDDLCSAMGSC